MVTLLPGGTTAPAGATEMEALSGVRRVIIYRQPTHSSPQFWGYGSPFCSPPSGLGSYLCHPQHAGNPFPWTPNALQRASSCCMDFQVGREQVFIVLQAPTHHPGLLPHCHSRAAVAMGERVLRAPVMRLFQAFWGRWLPRFQECYATGRGSRAADMATLAL